VAEALTIAPIGTFERVSRHVGSERPAAHIRDDFGELRRDKNGRCDVTDGRTLQIIGIECRPTHLRDLLGGIHDSIGDCPQLRQIDLNDFPHATCWQTGAQWR
jgi:hypothetical protein